MEEWQFPTPKLLYKIDMQARYAAARATVLEYTSSANFQENIFTI
jgi:hypothetical protein